MVKSGKKGFTLIELLAVIVILAIIALIATPIIVGVINKSKKNAFMDTAYGVVEAGRLYYAKNFGNDDFVGKTFAFPGDADDLKLSGEKIGGGSLEVTTKGKQVLAIYDKAKNWCASKTENEEKVTINKYEETTCKGDGDTGYSEPALSGAKPVLPEGLIPVIIGDYGTVTKADTTKEWYNYGDKRWANAILLTSDYRNRYQEGDTITAGILAYFVWVPRYEYKLFNSETPIEIQINFLAKKKTEPTKDYIIHPAFTFGEEELSGIWVGKFLTTTGSATEPNILPNQVPLQTNVYNLREQFKSALVFGNRTLNTDGTITNNLDKSKYGLTAESRMIRNTEWGAAAYLSHSKYGKNSEIAYNAMSRLDSGCGSFVGSPSMTECPHKYGNYATNSYPQSTTGDISGIFDMVGGPQHVMGIMADAVGSTTPMSGYDNKTNSGFNGKTLYSGNITTGYQFPDKKYYDLYDYGTTYNDDTAYNRAILGDATKETRGWYDDDSFFLARSAMCFVRGGSNSIGKKNGAFKFGASNGASDTSIYFRTVIS